MNDRIKLFYLPSKICHTLFRLFGYKIYFQENQFCVLSKNGILKILGARLKFKITNLRNLSQEILEDHTDKWDNFTI